MYLHSGKGKGYTVNLITNDNVGKYVKDIPSYFKRLCPAHQADFVRVNVICDYGGIWLDSDTLVMDALDTLFDLLDEQEGFFIKENNKILWNGVFGSNRDTPLMNEWKSAMRRILDKKGKNIAWSEVGCQLLQSMYDTNAALYSGYKVFEGLDTMYPVNWNGCVQEFLKKPYDNYKTLIRSYQPLVVLVNSVYKELECKPEKEILDSNMPLNYFIHKSFRNGGVFKEFNLNIESIDWCKTDRNNFGDMITPWLYTKFTKAKNVPRKRSNVLLGAGSILSFLTTKESIVWGSGLGMAELIGGVVRPKTVLSVRGVLTRSELENKGIKCPNLFGDPGLALSKVYNPHVDKKYKVGIIPHWIEYEIFKRTINDKDVVIINLQDNIEKVIDTILSCEATMSSSLHGIIASHSYKVPCAWVRLPENECKIKGGWFKFLDYYSSLQIFNVKPIIMDKQYSSQSIDKYFADIKSYANPEDSILNRVIYNTLYLCPISQLNEYSKRHIASSIAATN